MTHTLLIEIGTEELPASFVREALASLDKAAKLLFAEARLDASEFKVMGTPRRLALLVEGLAAKQAERSEQVIGPPWKVAFDAEGNLTKAGEGFLKKQGLTQDALEKHSTDKGDYIAANVYEKGRASAEVLVELLPEIASRISFPKSMRWAEGEVTFGRPIHWLIGLLDKKVLPFEFAGLSADRKSRGHRFLSPAELKIDHAKNYQRLLKKAHVWVDLEERREKMKELLNEAAKKLGGELQQDAFLIDECVSLIEEPFVVPGQIDTEFLALPDEVIVAVMRDHQRYFAVRNPQDGSLLPSYLNVVNTAKDPASIARGNDRVLRARLADARFFVEEDLKQPLESRLAKLDKVTFQTKLGSIGDKIRRICRITEHFCDTRPQVERNAALQAAKLCKADLETSIVFEFSELQGEMGRWYALREGLDAQVADALRDHYAPQSAEDPVPNAPVSNVVALADRLDTLVGCFAAGLKPSGSADPFALRRAALGIVRIALESEFDLALHGTLEFAFEGLQREGLLSKREVVAELIEFFRARMRVFLRNRYSADVIDACLGAWDNESILDLKARLDAVSAFRKQAQYQALATAFKRAHNITKDAERGPIDDKLLEAGAESLLAQRFQAVRPELSGAAATRDYERALSLVANELGEPIDRFFEDVFVMVDDPEVRTNRLRLLAAIADSVHTIAHLHHLSQQ